MTITKLTWNDLVPDTKNYQKIFNKLYLIKEDDTILSDTQPRLYYSLKQMLSPYANSLFMLIKASEEVEQLNIIADAIQQITPSTNTVYGGQYLIVDNRFIWEPAFTIDDKFAVYRNIITVEQAEAEQLFGCLRQFNGDLTLQPGLVHRSNGGVLVISLRSLLSQIALWTRLKFIVTHQKFEWFSWDKSHPLPVSIPSMPLSIKLVLVGDQESLAEFQEIEPEIEKKAIYGEFEDNIHITNTDCIERWCRWVMFIAKRYTLPIPATNAWPFMIREAVRYTGNQNTLPLCSLWISRQLREVGMIYRVNKFSSEHFIHMLSQREWKENYLAECMQDEIMQRQIITKTENERVGQINALSIVEFQDHPRRLFGDLSRISCVVYIGDGEFIDVESEVKLSGNIHNKGMMIIQAFLVSQLKLEQQIPFSASITFEQSYSEIDGDSASMAELCVLISALADVPINQNIAITGSVDQFGHAQPVGSLNEKIEGFFSICQKQGLNGKQGVIIPVSNVRNLSLSQNIIEAVDNEQFTLWSVENINDALFLLTNLVWDGEDRVTLMKTIQKRIARAFKKNLFHRYSWPLSWFKRFNKN